MEKDLTKKTLKNSGYNFLASFISKIGGLIFTIIIARMLAPELFGIYNLVLSLVLISLVFTDLGIRTAAMRYVSEKIGKNDILGARSYFRYLLKLKSLLLILAILIIILISKFLANEIFQKQLVLIPLLFSTIYILFFSIEKFFLNLFYHLKDLSKTPILEFVFEFFKILFSCLAIFFLSSKFVVAGIFIAMAIGAFITCIFILIFLGKNRNLFLGPVEDIEKRKILSYIKYMSIAGITLTFFGSIDTLMLGRYVEAEFIGFYRAALSLVYAVASFLTFGNVLLPIFTQIHGHRLERGFKKVLNHTLFLIIPACAGMILVSKYFILGIYGEEYIQASIPLYALAFLILTGPLIIIYESLLKSKENVKPIRNFLLISLFLNIALNFISIKFLLPLGEIHVILGVGISTVISRLFYLLTLAIKSKKYFKITPDLISLLKIILSTITMIIFLILFNSSLNINLFLGILEIFLGIFVYFLVMWLLKGFYPEDLKLFKSTIKKFFYKKS